ARDMIEAAGLVPGNDIAIEITGIRPGERLHERLHSDNETLVPTAFPGIDRIQPTTPPDLNLAKLQQLESAAQRRDADWVVELLQELAFDRRADIADFNSPELSVSRL
ncbi:MAG TPA: polysaccharide biosynthesis protein, partial [Acidisarcina sp.]